MNTKDIIEEVVTRHYNVSMDQIRSKTRKRNVVEPRQVYQVLLFEYANMSKCSIGLETNRDHATVLHSKTTINNLSDTDKVFNHKINYLRDQVHSLMLKNSKELENISDKLIKTEMIENADRIANIKSFEDHVKEIIINKMVSSIKNIITVKKEEVEDRQVKYSTQLFVIPREDFFAYVNSTIKSLPMSTIIELKQDK